MERVTHEAKVLALLSDGQPHSHMEGYRLGVMLHSRVAGLRKKGYRIECDKTGGQYVYRLLEARAVSVPQGTDGTAGASSSTNPPLVPLDSWTEPNGSEARSPIPTSPASAEARTSRTAVSGNHRSAATTDAASVQLTLRDAA